MKYITADGREYQGEPGSLVSINSQGHVRIHTRYGHTSNYISVESFEESLHSGDNIFYVERIDLDKLMEEIGL